MDSNLFLCGIKVTSLPQGSTLNDVSELLKAHYGLDTSDLYITCNGKTLNTSNKTIENNVRAEFRCRGGKGGFGSMLRAIGAQIEKTTNREACRDLSGRRLRDINEEKRLKAWLEKQKDRQEDAEEKKRKKLEKLLAVPKHNFKDAEYDNARTDMTEKVSEAVEEGFKKVSSKAAGPASSSCVKRKADEDKSGAKKKKLSLWIDDELSSTTESDDSDDDEGSTSKQSGTLEPQSSDKSYEGSGEEKVQQNTINLESTEIAPKNQQEVPEERV